MNATKEADVEDYLDWKSNNFMEVKTSMQPIYLTLKLTPSFIIACSMLSSSHVVLNSPIT